MDWFEYVCERLRLRSNGSSSIIQKVFLREELWEVYMLMRRWAREDHFEEYPHSKKKHKGPFKKRKMKK